MGLKLEAGVNQGVGRQGWVAGVGRRRARTWGPGRAVPSMPRRGALRLITMP